ncbi:MAG: undecaprenyl/decaprenyl-phosphate alpha-N-acetylglucosaminyl 1-phosphate transferase [Phycisphaerales bacterium]|nr:MAG: undecaprenyl/decaprenyl-phosphate alpha-N-acetylglucosaminyl 1-phosphate transferase [Phycisphaerales bacterium]
MFLLIAISFGGPLVMSVVLTALVRQWSIRRGFIDRPGGHKQHDRPVALGGGIAIAASVIVPVLAGAAAAWAVAGGGRAPPAGWPSIIAVHASGAASKLPQAAGIMLGAVVLHVVGLIDDRRPLGPWPKFAAQFAAAFWVSGVLGLRAVQVLGPLPSAIVTAVWIVLITNAFNFLDNIDGLSAGVGAIASIILAVTAVRAGQVFVPAMALALAGALTGYLFFNFPPARIFMGDAGSLVIGYLLGVLTILTTYYDPRLGLSPVGVAVPVLVLSVPLYDVISVVTHRVRLGLSPLKGDRRHFSHRLVRKGMSVRGAVLTIYLATAATGLSAIALPRVGGAEAALLLGQCVLIVVMIAVLEHVPGRHENRADG